MKKSFTKEYILANKGCYSVDQVLELPFGKTDKITINGLFKALPIKDFNWFLVRKCKLTLTEKRLFALHCAKQVLPIFENKYPNDSRVRDCIDATERYLNGNETLENLKVFRDAADAAADAAYAAAYAADAAYVAYAAYAAAYAYAAVAYAANDAADAADDDAAYKLSILNFVKSL
jgi:hypothetical protein